MKDSQEGLLDLQSAHCKKKTRFVLSLFIWFIFTKSKECTCNVQVYSFEMTKLCPNCRLKHTKLFARRCNIHLLLFNRFGPEARPSGGAIHRNQMHQRGVPERPRTGGQWLSRRSDSSQGFDMFSLLSIGTLPKVRH